MYKLGIIGCGHMAKAILHAFLQQAIFLQDEVLICDHHPEKLQQSAYHTSDDLNLICQCPYLMIGVRPNQIDALLKQLPNTNATIISMAAGVTIAHIQSLMPSQKVIRIMPNTPIEVSHGATGLCASFNTPKGIQDEVLSWFTKVGTAAYLPEEHLDYIITVSGSTPAYFYYFLDILYQDACHHGVDPNIARSFLIETMIGCGHLLQDQPQLTFLDRQDQVCSKGGTTEQAILTMQEHHIQKIIQLANENCLKKAFSFKK